MKLDAKLEVPFQGGKAAVGVDLEPVGSLAR